MTSEYPSFADLPLKKDGPHGNAWGLWGPEDQVGTLNHLTEDTVARAAKEHIKSGKRVSLKYVRLFKSRHKATNPEVGSIAGP
jgi:hypothetical protein